MTKPKKTRNEERGSGMRTEVLKFSSGSNFVKANFTSENGQNARLSQHEKRNHISQMQMHGQSYTKARLKRAVTGHCGQSNSLSQGRGPGSTQNLHSWKKYHISPTLTCVKAGMIVFLLEDALGLRVESEP